MSDLSAELHVVRNSSVNVVIAFCFSYARYPAERRIVSRSLDLRCRVWGSLLFLLLLLLLLLLLSSPPLLVPHELEFLLCSLLSLSMSRRRLCLCTSTLRSLWYSQRAIAITSILSSPISLSSSSLHSSRSGLVHLGASLPLVYTAYTSPSLSIHFWTPSQSYSMCPQSSFGPLQTLH